MECPSASGPRPTYPLSPDALRRVLLAAGVNARLAHRYAPSLAWAMDLAKVDTRDRVAHFLAQVLHESAGLLYTAEVWGPTRAQRRYEGRRDLGNVRPGDGYRYRGRDVLQVTGRDNYRQCTEWWQARGVDVDFEAEPDRLASEEFVGFGAAWYWATRGLNGLADRGDTRRDVARVTRRVNGGYNGLADRVRWFVRVGAALNRMA
ncbi:MAG TPA: glycoside hydrolase family 19 protein [Bacteroidetes bacterium]|nr:glycoside hydrolase family 19 protein [Bacteroidota bacterium]